MKLHKTRPVSGVARKLWDSLTTFGFDLVELHYNPNCWQKLGTANQGWGTWALEAHSNPVSCAMNFCWCGWDKEKCCAYTEQMAAPFIRILCQ